MGSAWSFIRLRGTVFSRIWYKVLLLILYTGVIVGLHLYVPKFKMEFKQTLIPILGVVTGLLLVFRTNTAYDRYWEGRRLWGQMTGLIRTLSRCIWINVKEETVKDVIEKKSIINVLLAFAVATKYYLRHEYSYECGDLKELIKHLPSFATPSSNEPLTEQDLPVRKGFWTTRGAHDTATPTNIPIELTYYVAGYIYASSKRGLLETPVHSLMQSSLSALTECLTSFERILRTPIPMAYSIHLTYCTWIYILALPYQLVNDLEWWTIPAVGLASISLLGILEIGMEIENPFGHDTNDLPLDDFCNVMRREVRMIIGSNIPKPEDWIHNSQNHPFHETCPDLDAIELSKFSLDQLRDVLSNDAQHSLYSTPAHGTHGKKQTERSMIVLQPVNTYS